LFKDNDKFFMNNPLSISSDVSQIVEKCSMSQCCKILQKFLDPDVTDFQNFIHLFIEQRYIFGKIFVKMRSVFLTRSC